ncbi:MAG TPA: hypothetical protein VN886_08890 [Acidimicrobiales bacterium]|nr:hypothetical protein [Acidimicrobiales bacterium]
MIGVQAAFLANAAQGDPSGLVSSLGGFIDTLFGPQLPVRQQVWLVGRLTVDEEDAIAAHNVVVLVEHQDGTEQVARIDIPLPGATVDRVAQFDHEMPIGVPLAVLLPLEFRRLGVYLVRIVVDGDEIWSQRLKIKTTVPQL